MSKVNMNQAVEEVNSWLDFKKVSEKKRKDSEDQIEAIAEGVAEGVLRINDDFEIIQTLSFPIGENNQIQELVFKPRVTVSDLNNKTRAVKSGDADGRIIAYICALTGQSSGVIKQLDSVDYSIPQNIAVFFL